MESWGWDKKTDSEWWRKGRKKVQGWEARIGERGEAKRRILRAEDKHGKGERKSPCGRAKSASHQQYGVPCQGSKIRWRLLPASRLPFWAGSVAAEFLVITKEMKNLSLVHRKILSWTVQGLPKQKATVRTLSNKACPAASTGGQDIGKLSKPKEPHGSSTAPKCSFFLKGPHLPYRNYYCAFPKKLQAPPGIASLAACVQHFRVFCFVFAQNTLLFQKHFDLFVFIQ